MILTCERTRLMMSDLLDGRLTEQEAAALKEHLHTCRECSMRWQMLRRVSSVFEGAGMATPPPDFTSSVMNRLATAEAHKEASFRSHALWLAASGLVATFVLLILAATTLSSTTVQATPSPSSALGIFSMSMNVSGAALWVAAVIRSTMTVAADVSHFIPLPVVILFLLWLSAGTLALAVTVAKLVSSYWPLEAVRSQ